MATRKSRAKQRQVPPATTPEAREDQLINLAIDTAEQQMLNGTASSQVITHFLKLGSTREELEQEKLRQETTLVQAKAESIQSMQRMEDLYTEALDAMRLYSGQEQDTHGDEEILGTL